MKSNEHILRTRDGRLIAFALHVPPQGAGGRVLVIAPEAGLEQGFYQPMATWCAQQGISVITFDYRSFGQSALMQSPHRADTIRQWANQDLDAVLCHTRHSFPADEIILLAHGLSGQIAGMAASIEKIDFLALVGSALHARRLWPRANRAIAAMQGLAALPEQVWARRFLPNPEKIQANIARELFEWSSYPHGFFDLFPDYNYRRLNVPLLALNFSDDPHTPRRAIEKLLRHYGPSRMKQLLIRPADFSLKHIGHNGFFNAGNEKLWCCLVNWLHETSVEKRYFF